MARRKQRPTQGKPTPAASASARKLPVLPIALFVLVVLSLVGPPVTNTELRLDLMAVLLGVGGVAVAVALLASRKWTFPDPRVAIPAVALFVWLLACSLASSRVWAALVGEPANRIGWMTLAALGPLALAATWFSSDVLKLLRRHAWWIVLLESVLTVGQFVITRDSLVGGTLQNSTYLGEALVLLLPWTMPAEEHTQPRQRAVRYLAILLAVLALGLVRSRAALVVTVFWALWAIAKKWKVPLRAKVASGVAVIVISAAAAVGFLPGSVFDTDGSLAFGGRVVMWQQSALAVLDRPVVGYGPDGYWPAVASIRTPEVARAGHSLLLGPRAVDPHNFVVWIAVSGGLVGLALAVWLAVVVIASWRRRWSSEPMVSAAAWSLGGCLLIGLTAPLNLKVLPLFALVIGASLFDPKRDAAAVAVPVWHRRAWTVILVVAALACTVFALNGLTRAQYEVADATRSPLQVMGAAEASTLWSADAHLAYVSSLHAGWAARMDPGNAEQWQELDIAALDRARRLDQRNPFYALEYARAVKFYGLPAEQVDAAYLAAFVRYPAFPLARAEYALYLAESGRADDAREQLEVVRGIDDPDQLRIDAVEDAEALLAGKAQ